MSFLFTNPLLIILVWLLIVAFPVFLYREGSIAPTVKKTVIIAVFSLPTFIIGSVFMALVFLYQENKAQERG